MKFIAILSIVIILITAGSCSKDPMVNPARPPAQAPARKVRFELFTNEDFSTDLHNIQFTLRIQTSSRVLLDSALAKIQIKDIPDSAHRIIIEKWVPGNDTSRLAVGFIYEIENIGVSWHIEDFPAGDTLKVVQYPFR